MKKTKLFLTFFLVLSLLFFSHLYSKQTYLLKTPGYHIETTEDGFQKIIMKGFHSYAVSGYPDLPARIYRAAVPPGVDLESIKVSFYKKGMVSLGTFDIREIPAMQAYVDGKTITGDKADVYTKNNFFPGNCIEYAGFSRMRKWRIVSVKYTPFQYNPVTKELRLISAVEVTIDYKTGERNRAIERELTDFLMDKRAEKYIMNYGESLKWYRPGREIFDTETTYDYVIVTTNAIESASTKLADFVTYLIGKGFSPLVITEDEYGGLTGQAPNGTAEKIRKWLQDNYIAYGIEYVLLVGNPDPDDPSSGSDPVGDVPMKMCWPRYGSGSYEESPTDSFYADLTGNWDLDGDLYYGEWSDFTGSGGVDFANEVYVGRIPVYSGVTELDSILTKTINYGNAADTSWRASALLPMSFSSATYDGAPLAEQMMDDYLSAAGYSTWTQYQQGNGACGLDSTYPSDEELRGGTVVRDRWAANDYGLVVWWGHGSTASAIVGYSGCDDGYLMYYTYAPALDNDHPAIVYQNSCYNGLPENSLNLEYALLKNGSIAAVAASRVSWYNSGVGYGDFDGSTTNSGIGYEFASRITAEQPAGNALCNTKASMTPEMNTRLMNFYDFNLYGDPAISIADSGGNITVTAPNGGECWQIGTSRDITWTAAGVSGNLKITLWQDGLLLGIIADEVDPAAGVYAWTVGQHSGGTTAPGTGYTVKIKEKGAPVSDTSDAAFSLATLSVTSPNGGENWDIGDTRDITWTSAGLTGNLKITLWKDGISLGVIADEVDPAGGAYAWTVGQHSGGTAAAGTGYTVKIKQKGAPVADESDTAFTLSSTGGSITVTSPNGGENWPGGSGHNITWTCSGVTGDVKITLYKDGVFVGLVADNVDPAAGTFAWTVGQYSGGTAPAGTGYTVKIKEKGALVSDTSDAAFTITGISVTSPNGGESWQLGASENITWTAAGVSGNVKITLWKDGLQVGLIQDNLAAGAGSYSWTVGQHSGGTAPAGTGYTVKIKQKGALVSDTSDATFSLAN